MDGRTLVPESLLARSDKILFMTPLALGDFTYLYPFFKAFSQKYPHIQIDLWIERMEWLRSLRRLKPFTGHLLLDWVKQTGLFTNIYVDVRGDTSFKTLVQRAQRQEYPVVIFLGTIKRQLYAHYAKKIAPRGLAPTGLVVGVSDDGICASHISNTYKRWFDELFGFSFDKTAPSIAIPRAWVSYGKLKFVKWEIPPSEKRFEKVLFLNPFARNTMRCWPLDRVVKLIAYLREQEGFEDAYVIINVEPKLYKRARDFLSNYCLQRVFLFTAETNFFQLPSVISLCDLVISVENSVVHLASALQIPVVALMRRKNPEWGPFYEKQSTVVFAPKRRDWVEDISVEQVVISLRQGFLPTREPMGGTFEREK